MAPLKSNLTSSIIRLGGRCEYISVLAISSAYEVSASLLTLTCLFATLRLDYLLLGDFALLTLVAMLVFDFGGYLFVVEVGVLTVSY